MGQEEKASQNHMYKYFMKQETEERNGKQGAKGTKGRGKATKVDFFCRALSTLGSVKVIQISGGVAGR